MASRPARWLAVLLLSMGVVGSGAALAQNQATQPFLLTVDACPQPGTTCSQGPTSQLTHLLQSPDGVNWTPVPGFTPFEGGVAGIVRRNDTIYIVTQAPPSQNGIAGLSLFQTVKYHVDTGVQDPPIIFTPQDNQFPASTYMLQDPSLALNPSGQLVVIYDVSNVPGPSCPSGTCHVRMAIEVSGSDGTQFVAQTNDAATYSATSGGDPSAPYFDGTQWIMYAGNSPPPPNPVAELAVTSSTFAGPYSLYQGLPSGEISTQGQQFAGFFNTALAQYWDYFASAGNIAQAVTPSLNTPVTAPASSTVVSNATLGTSGQNIQHPHFAVNWSGSPSVEASVLPASRSATVSNPVTAFATMINSDVVNAADCYIAPSMSIPATFTYQTTNPSTNQVIGSANTPATIGGNDGTQSFVFAVTPTAAFPPTNVQLTFACASSTSATPITGVSTILLSGSTTPVPDIVALAASGDPGIVDLTSPSNAGAFAVATVNVGASASINATVDTGSATLPVSLSICQTSPTTGQCLAPPASSVSVQINANATPTFGIFVAGSATVPFDPATNRVFVRFTDNTGAGRGATSVAVRTQ